MEPGADKSPIRALLFDFSGVIVVKTKGKRRKLFATIEREYGVPKKALKAELLRLGLANMDAKELSAVIHRPLAALLERPVSAFAHERPRGSLIQENVALISSLRGKFKIAVVANSDGTVAERLERLGIRDLFDCIIDSGVIGISKPDAGIYLEATSRLGCAPEECLFVDNKLENVIGARALGMEAFLYAAHLGDNLERLLAERGVRSNSLDLEV